MARPPNHGGFWMHRQGVGASFQPQHTALFNAQENHLQYESGRFTIPQLDSSILGIGQWLPNLRPPQHNLPDSALLPPDISAGIPKSPDLARPPFTGLSDNHDHLHAFPGTLPGRAPLGWNVVPDYTMPFRQTGAISPTRNHRASDSFPSENKYGNDEHQLQNHLPGYVNVSGGYHNDAPSDGPMCSTDSFISPSGPNMNSSGAGVTASSGFAFRPEVRRLRWQQAIDTERVDTHRQRDLSYAAPNLRHGEYPMSRTSSITRSFSGMDGSLTPTSLQSSSNFPTEALSLNSSSPRSQRLSSLDADLGSTITTPSQSQSPSSFLFIQRSDQISAAGGHVHEMKSPWALPLSPTHPATLPSHLGTSSATNETSEAMTAVSGSKIRSSLKRRRTAVRDGRGKGIPARVKKAKFACGDCTTEFSSTKDVKRHYSSVHQRLKYRCPGCSKLSSRPDNLRRHMQKSCPKKGKGSFERSLDDLMCQTADA